MTLAKICGLKTPDAIESAIYGCADFVGFVFHPQSPRFVDISVAAYLAHYIPPSLKVVGLFVDAPMDVMAQTMANVRLDMIQLHGAESPADIRAIKDRFQKPIIKSLSVSSAADITKAEDYIGVADWLLLDSGGGGTGTPFDWGLLDGFRPPIPWMLAGGLHQGNVREAIERFKPDAVDVSSGVESARGVKDPDKIRAFLAAVKNA